jgi:catechol 2,3-dioxygenase-like lactoylglutathione lyase family enzyme
MRAYDAYSSRNEWGVDHFGLVYEGDLKAICESMRDKGAIFSVEPWEFTPGSLLCYVAAPDGVNIEIAQAKS